MNAHRKWHQDNDAATLFDAAPDYIFPVDTSSIQERINHIRPAQYAKTRNFLRGAVTLLSPYISRGVIQLPELKDMLLQQYGYRASEKLISELAWREFFQRIWQAKGDAILQDLRNEQSPISTHQIPAAVINANTGITGIDQSIQALYASGYMHNHARMYTAMLTTNIAQAHWRLPAQWMYYHLLDGDIASNHLSWQWVAGSFSSKKYYANQENINKYTGHAQRNSFLDVDYSAFADMPIPEILQATAQPQLLTPLPSMKSPSIVADLPTLVYNTYHLDPNWYAGEAANRILLLEPDHFAAYPISEKVLNWIIQLAHAQVPGIQVFSGNFQDLMALLPEQYPVQQVFYKEHPTTRHYKGVEESRSWLFPQVQGYFNSFFAYWKKCERFLR
jgi:deoxyribodipyrimidine photo-lyase